ncbi:cold-shock protein [Photobacterium lutimaris]|uniref:CSD domain-containing protein n=1 Tax=Photobacterium lutimaris TaxID=388278 RepID=A0A2T3IL40_9GAMM|nr:hypothetical protein C9I99_25400 [Photobacterium lutimaris]
MLTDCFIEDCVTTKTAGTVKWFNEAKRFGFIPQDNGGNAVFFYNKFKCDGKLHHFYISPFVIFILHVILRSLMSRRTSRQRFWYKKSCDEKSPITKRKYV